MSLLCPCACYRYSVTKMALAKWDFMHLADVLYQARHNSAINPYNLFCLINPLNYEVELSLDKDEKIILCKNLKITKSINLCQSARTAQADISRNFSQMHSVPFSQSMSQMSVSLVSKVFITASKIISVLSRQQFT